MIFAWEQSGNGFGQRDLKADRSWGTFTDEHRELEFGDNRADFLKVLGTKQTKNREHLLYLWHLVDMNGILENVLNVLSKDICVDTDGTLRITAAQSQNKRKKTIEREREARERKAYRRDTGSAIKDMAGSAIEDNITAKQNQIVDLQKALAETEVQVIVAENDRIKAVYKKLQSSQQKMLNGLNGELSRLINKRDAYENPSVAANDDDDTGVDDNSDSGVE